MNLNQKLKRASAKAKSREPVWKGPEVDGITVSLLSRFLCCRERFRLLVIEGLRPAPAFQHRMEYGQMWHVCEEAIAENATSEAEFVNDVRKKKLPAYKPSPVSWEEWLREYAEELCGEYRQQQEQVEHWYNVCKVQFPVYLDYWRKHSDEQHRERLLSEYVFKVPYELPSGRMVLLRGKWDSVCRIGESETAGIYLQENKTKGDIDEQMMKQQLASGFELQTMFYLVALAQLGYEGRGPDGVRYNVVRRPLSGGKHSIRQLQPTKNNPQGETAEAFYARLGDLIASEPEWFFMRWRVEVSARDIIRFRQQCLDPVLEQLCDWWDWVSKYAKGDPFSKASSLHWRYPYGVYNVLQEGGMAEVDEYLNTGSELGLERTTELFKELQ